VRMLTNLERLATTRGDRAALRWILACAPPCPVPRSRAASAWRRCWPRSARSSRPARPARGRAEELTGDAAEAAPAAARRLRAS
jgi:hypothetical protein